MITTLLRRAAVRTLDGVSDRAQASERPAVRVAGRVLDRVRALTGLDLIPVRSPLPEWDGSQPEQPMWPSDQQKLHKFRVAQGVVPAEGEAAEKKPAIEVYFKRGCPYTRAAVGLLQEREYAFGERDVTDDEVLRAWLKTVTGRKTTPQIFIGGESIGGFDELRELDHSGELARRVEALVEATKKEERRGPRIRLPVLGAHPERSPFEDGGPEIAADPGGPAEILEGDVLLTRVREVLDELRPIVQSDGGDIELLDVRPDEVTVGLTGNCIGCPSSQATLRQGIERRLRQQIPQIRRIRSPQLDAAAG